MTALVIAHRGSPSEAHENSIESILLARKHRADLIEIDVQPTKDGVIVLHHDDDLLRSAGVAKRVDELSFAELSLLPLAFDGDPPEDVDRAATLAEAVEAARPVPLAVEIKTGDDARGAEVARLVLAALDAARAPDETRLISFSRAAVVELLRQRPADRVGLIRNREYGEEGWKDGLGLDARIAVLSMKITTPERVRALKDAGRSVWVYSLDDEESIRAQLASGVDGVVSNRPGLARAVVDG